MRDQLDPDHWCNGGEYGSSHPDALAMEALDAENKQLRAEVERLKEARRWISVEERLPDNDEQMLVFDGISNDITYYWQGAWRLGFQSGITRVTHWMPLPEPPKMEVQP